MPAAAHGGDERVPDGRDGEQGEEDRERDRKRAELSELDDRRRQRGREREDRLLVGKTRESVRSSRDRHARTPADEHIVGDAVGAGVGPEGGAEPVVGEPRAVVVVGV